MSILPGSNIRRYESVAELVDVSVSMPLFTDDVLTVYYGEIGLTAVLNVDYDIILNEVDYSNFIFRPFAGLITKINAQIAADPNDRNTVLLVRTLPLSTASTPASARNSDFVSREFDRITMKFQQLQDFLDRTFKINRFDENTYNLDMPGYSANAFLGWHPTLKKIINVAGTISSLLVDTDPTFAANSDLLVPSQKAVKTAIREKLTANRTYYVRTDGNDANTGLVNTAGGAFLTLAAAINAAYLLDARSFNITIQLADGTYAAGASLVGPILGHGTLTIQGNTANAAAVVVNGGISLNNGARATVQWLTIANAAGTALLCQNNSALTFGNLRFGTTSGNHILTVQARTTCNGDYEIIGGASWHIWCESNSDTAFSSRAISLTGTPAFSGGYVVAFFSKVTGHGCTFVGTATGKRYQSSELSIIGTGTSGVNTTYYPGNSAGSTDTGGVYN